MKKIVLLLAAALTVGASWAQKTKVKSAENNLNLQQFDQAKIDIDEALVNERTINDPNTYITASNVYIELAISGRGDENTLNKSKEFIEKAEELDAKGNEKGKGIGRARKAIDKFYATYTLKLETYGGIAWNNKNFKDAKNAFDYAVWVNKHLKREAYQEVSDTTNIFNAGIAAMNDQDFKMAAERFVKSAELGYDGPNSILRANMCYGELKDSASIEKTLKFGFEKYPENKDVLLTLIQFYLNADRSKEALVYLDEAIAKDPENVQYYFARGCLNEKVKPEDAVGDYEKALQKDPNFFNALYNLGVIYYNRGTEKEGEASNERDNKKYEALKKQADEIFLESAPYFEKAAKSAETENNKANQKLALEVLKSIYYRLQSADLVSEDKYTSVMTRLKALEE